MMNTVVSHQGVLRRLVHTSNNTFYSNKDLATSYEKTKYLLLDLCRVNGEILGDHYPGLCLDK